MDQVDGCERRQGLVRWLARATKTKAKVGEIEPPARQKGRDGEIEVFTSADGEVRVDVKVEGETVWLSLNQIAELFDRDKSVISKHLKDIYKSGELDREATVAKNATVQKEGSRQVTREIEYFNLDAILSVGYRVNSKRGTQFRIWATKRLREHLVDGFTVNRKRLENRGEKGLKEMEQTLDLLVRTLRGQHLLSREGEAVLDVVSQYARTWRLLLEYDENRLPEAPAKASVDMKALSLDEAETAIVSLKTDLIAKGEATPLFGQARGEGLDGALGAIEQTFAGEPLYPSIEARAAHLLYFVIKDHPFADGNKRIGSLLFLKYLDRNGRLTGSDGKPRFDDRALVALALLIAESDRKQKDLMVRLVISLLDDRSEERSAPPVSGAGRGKRARPGTDETAAP